MASNEERGKGRESKGLGLAISGMLLFSFSAAPAIFFHSRLSSVYLREIPPTVTELSQLGLLAFSADLLTIIGAFLTVAGLLRLAHVKPVRIVLMLGLIAVVFTASLTYGIPLTVQQQPGPTIMIRNYVFSGSYVPPYLVVVLGVNSTVTWTNDRNSIHPDTLVSDTGLFNSGLIPQGASWSYTFTAVGIYPYHSVIHFWMHGTVQVVAP